MKITEDVRKYAEEQGISRSLQILKSLGVRGVPLIVAILFFSAAAFAGEIREFDLKTVERLGNELTRVSQTSDKWATDSVRKRAKQTAIAALKGKLFNIHYDYVVLDDPDGSGFLVYALGTTKNSDEVVLSGHFRVTVSGDGEKAERVDALSRSLLINSKKDAPPGTKMVGMHMAQIVSSKPLETLIYTSNLTKMPIAAGTVPNGQIWFIENGKITKSNSKE
jgi:hypothetical protein